MASLDSYPDWLRENTALSESSISLYARTARRFFEDGHQIEPGQINAYIAQSFRNSHSCYVKYTFRYLLKFLGKSKIYKGLIPVKVPPRKRMGKHYPERMVRKIILNIRKELLRDQALLQYKTGARAREIITLREENIDFDFSPDILKARLIGKGGKERPTFLSKDCAEILQKYCKGTARYLFLHEGCAVDPEQLERAVNTNRSYLYEALKVSAHELGLSGFGTHDFRRNVAERIRKLTKDPYVAKKILGHSKIETTLRYFDESPEDVQEAIINMQKGDTDG